MASQNPNRGVYLKRVLSKHMSSLIYVVLLSSCCGLAQAPVPDTSARPQAAVLPRGTPLEIKIAQHQPAKMGELIHGTLVYPVYVNDELVLPFGTVVNGTVVALSSDKAKRRDAHMNADFTPYSEPVVTFSQIVLANGAVLPIATDQAQNGSQIVHLAAQEKSQKSMLARQRSAIGQQMNETKRVFTAPGRGDRFTQILYRLLP